MRSVGNLFVVIVLLAIGIWAMVRMVEPRLRERREEELRKLCASRLGQLALALHFYLERTDNLLPPPKNWCDALEEFVPPSRRPFVFHCPKLEAEKGYGFAFNAYAWDGEHNTPKWHPEMYPPSQVVLIYETTQKKRNAVGTGEDIPNPGRHGGYNLFLFADGSTMVLTPEEVREMMERGELRFKPLRPPTR